MESSELRKRIADVVGDTQYIIATHAGIHRSTLNRWLNGKQKLSAATERKIEKATEPYTLRDVAQRVEKTQKLWANALFKWEEVLEAETKLREARTRFDDAFTEVRLWEANHKRTQEEIDEAERALDVWEKKRRGAKK